MASRRRRIGKYAAVAMAASVAAGVAAFVGPWEGLFVHPYRDIVGVLTVCYGETEGPFKQTYTPQECRDMLAAKLPRYYAEISSCWGPEGEKHLTDNMRIAFTSGAYNFGSGAFCQSAMVTRLIAGNRKGACAALLAYDHAGGRKVYGLTRRRQAEYKLCMTDIDK